MSRGTGRGQVEKVHPVSTDHASPLDRGGQYRGIVLCNSPSQLQLAATAIEARQLGMGGPHDPLHMIEVLPLGQASADSDIDPAGYSKAAHLS
jgi:hypothetical protein